MAAEEVELAPWLANKPAEEQVEVAPWLNKPSTSEDMVKTAAPSLLKGTLGLLTTPGTLSNLPGKAAEGLTHYFAPDSRLDKFFHAMRELDTDEKGNSISEQHTLFPDYDTALKKTEEHTGKLYEPQTTGGKMFGLGLQALPNLATGMEGVVPTVMRAAGAGVAGEGARGAAEALGLPQWAQTAAEMGGMALGTGAPAVARRAVTPLPVDPARAATVNALRTQNFPMTAGQATDRPWLMSMEGRLGSNTPQQEAAFTNEVMRRAGSGGDFSAPNLQVAAQTGDQLGQLRAAHDITPAETAGYVRDTRNIQSQLARSRGGDVGQQVTPAVRASTVVRPGTTPNTFYIPGQRYDELRGILQREIDNAASPSAASAVGNMRRNLDQAFYNSVPPDVAARAQELNQQYANYSTLKGIPPREGRTTVTPQEVLNAVSSKMGRGFANQEQGNLAPYAQQAGSVMQELPKRNTEISPITDLVGTLASAAFHGTAGREAGMIPQAAEGAVVGHLSTPGVVNSGKDIVAHLLRSQPMQDYLGNTHWLPGQFTRDIDRRDLAKLLATSPELSKLMKQ